MPRGLILPRRTPDLLMPTQRRSTPRCQQPRRLLLLSGILRKHHSRNRRSPPTRKHNQPMHRMWIRCILPPEPTKDKLHRKRKHIIPDLKQTRRLRVQPWIPQIQRNLQILPNRLLLPRRRLKAALSGSHRHQKRLRHHRRLRVPRRRIPPVRNRTMPAMPSTIRLPQRKPPHVPRGIPNTRTSSVHNRAV